MAIGLMIIGDEILSGKYLDKHFTRVIEILAERGMKLDWARYLGDDPIRITETLKETYRSGDIVFCCGGIGSTPDDYTRVCAAKAFSRPLVMHPDARKEIDKRIREIATDPAHPDYETPENIRRLKMGEFPMGSAIIPNPINHFPGFSFGTHYFVPGFPQMAHPMIAWALDTYHKDLFHLAEEAELAVNVPGMMEARLTPLMEKITKDFPLIKLFSLPHIGPKRSDNYIEVGVKGKQKYLQPAFDVLLEGLDRMGAYYVQKEAH